MIVKQIIQEWKPIRRKLDREGQEAFDRVMIKMQLHRDAGSYACLPNPVETMLLSALVEYQKLLRELPLSREPQDAHE